MAGEYKEYVKEAEAERILRPIIPDYTGGVWLGKSALEPKKRFLYFHKIVGYFSYVLFILIALFLADILVGAIYVK